MKHPGGQKGNMNCWEPGVAGKGETRGHLGAGTKSNGSGLQSLFKGGVPSHSWGGGGG